MADIVLNARTLPDALFRLIRTEKVKVHEADGGILLTPIKETTDDCPFLGLYSDGKLTVDTFLKWKREEMDLER
jgi:hypothetical protein